MKCWLWGEMGKPEYQGKIFKKGQEQSREPTNSTEYEFKPQCHLGKAFTLPNELTLLPKADQDT